MAEMNSTKLENEELDNSSILGLTVALPAVPLDGSAAVEVSNIVNQVSRKWNVKPFHNFASIGELTFEGFYRIYFSRSDKQAIKVGHRWSEELHSVLKENNYLPYRIDNERMKDFIDSSSIFWNTVKKIKGTLDESNIIARGKYNVS